MPITTPINKFTEKIVQDNGTVNYKVYNKMSPHYYMDKTGSYHSIDVTDIQTITKDSVGVIKLREKNIASIGLRTDGNKTKYLGMRPDDTQEDGTQQLEWTINEAIINNTTQSITLNQTSSINDITTNLGGQVVQSTRYYTRQMVPVTGSISNFKVKYTLDLTGLQVSNTKYTEDTTIRNDISSSGTITVGTSYYEPDKNGFFKIGDNDNNVKFRISEPLLLDSNLNVIQHLSQSITTGSETYNSYISNPTAHTLKDNGNGTCEYTKYPSDDLLKTQITGNVKYIDATTIYSETDLDGTTNDGGSFQTFTNVHNATTANSADGDDASDSTSVGVTLSSFSKQIRRAHFGFDTSGISATPSAAEFRVKTKTNNSADFICLEGTHTDISTGTYNDFTGFETNFDVDNLGGSGAGNGLVPYSEEVSDVAANNSVTEITLLDAALSAIGSNDVTKIAVLQFDNDAKLVDSFLSLTVNTGFFFSDDAFGDSGTTSDPYLYITEALAPIQVVMKLISGNLTLKGGTLTIK